MGKFLAKTNLPKRVCKLKKESMGKIGLPNIYRGKTYVINNKFSFFKVKVKHLP